MRISKRLLVVAFVLALTLPITTAYTSIFKKFRDQQPDEVVKIDTPAKNEYPDNMENFPIIVDVSLT
jgi:hypothetical protein